MHKVLIVDDEPHVLESIRRLLRKHYEVLTCNSPKQALQIVSTNKDLAVVISDYQMPEENGVDFLLQIKTLVPQAVRTILSGQIDNQQLMRAINLAEIHRIILKPWDNDYLLLQIAESVQAHALLKDRAAFRYLSITDPITGLYNHRYFQEQLNLQMNSAKNNDKPISVIMIDVDHFKSFNDRYGHPEGDRLLSMVGSVIQKHCPPHGVACRYGGEEFAMILAGKSLQDAGIIAEQIRAQIECEDYAGPNQQRLFITASFGVASFPEHGNKPREIVSAADTALYKAKADGRNRVVIT
ncbi:MAG: diguanylate cyclase [Pseudobdellovibrionaceae bacterium]|nr:diguanylate cyclase [Bdellovibrionales bacterium]USN46407.1 MAG: diguanylate cyclase [Pseudobdellovibrionaceae bacterium]